MWSDAGRSDRPFDLVHATAFPYAWPIACGLRLARRLRVPFVLTPFLHLGDPEDKQDRTRQAYLSPPLLYLIHSADCIFVQTTIEREALLSADVPPHKLVMLGMGVEPEECTGGDRERTRQSWDVAANEVVIGHLANNSVEKGTVDLLKAVQGLERQGLHFHVVLAGPDMPNFKRFWETFGRKERVRCLGTLDERQKRDFFAALDIFALPSRSDSFGLVLLEAWANGIPNVAYRAGGVAEVIHPGEDGLLVRCGDLDGLGAALAQLIRDAELRRKLGSTGNDRVRSEFRWKDKLDRVREVYEITVRDSAG
jgi:glycosyltransferase involved in cell wall biosynthesis